MPGQVLSCYADVVVMPTLHLLTMLAQQIVTEPGRYRRIIGPPRGRYIRGDHPGGGQPSQQWLWRPVGTMPYTRPAAHR